MKMSLMLFFIVSSIQNARYTYVFFDSFQWIRSRKVAEFSRKFIHAVQQPQIFLEIGFLAGNPFFFKPAENVGIFYHCDLPGRPSISANKSASANSKPGKTSPPDRDCVSSNTVN